MRRVWITVKSHETMAHGARSAVLKVESLQEMRLRQGFEKIQANTVVLELGATVMSCAKPSWRNLALYHPVVSDLVIR